MKYFKGQIELKGEYKIDFSDNYFEIYNSKGNLIYFEDSDGEWFKREYDSKSNITYFEDSDGYIVDSRPKKVLEVTMKDLEEKYGCKVKIIKEER